MRRCLALFVLLMLPPAPSHGSVFGEVTGVVKDPQGKAVSGAVLVLKARGSAFAATRTSGETGAFAFRAVPLGEYTLTTTLSGFKTVEKALTVGASGARAQEIELPVADLAQSVEVSAIPEAIGSDSPTPTVLVGKDQIAATPGADRANSLASITTYVPGSWTTHDQLHIRGGHQVSWLVDGVPVANTNIASNVGPQFHPEDIDYLEVQRGGYSAEYGDRTYGVFNVVPRTGFERSREAEVQGSYGSFTQTNDYLSLGDHNDHLAYYASFNYGSSDHGLSPPTSAVLHDSTEGYGAFASLIDEMGPKDELRVVASARKDRYDIPNDPDSEAQGIADVEKESDAFLNVSLVHTLSTGAVLTLSPFFHLNEARYEGGLLDTPVIPDEGRVSRYLGAQASVAWTLGAHELHGGFYLFSQWDSASFALTKAGGAGSALSHEESPKGNLEAVFLEDAFHVTKRLTATAGVRFTHFSGSLAEDAASPRGGVTYRVPGLEWTLRAFYGRYYQAPPLSTVSGPLLDFALAQGFSFLPLHGERDEERELGVTVPVREWTLDVNAFRTGVRNFFDHNAINSSNIFLPLTIDRARIRALEVVVRSPKSFKAGEVSLAYSLQEALGQGAVTGGLTDFEPASSAYYPLDHDQRQTLSLAWKARVRGRGVLSTVLRYGSGFADGSAPPPAHLPGHVTADASFAYRVTGRLSLALNALNLANASYLLDNSATFGGTHWSDPREVYLEARYRFRY
jgi:outer membrane receptor protein involved in Fe transport